MGAKNIKLSQKLERSGGFSRFIKFASGSFYKIFFPENVPSRWKLSGIFRENNFLWESYLQLPTNFFPKHIWQNNFQKYLSKTIRLPLLKGFTEKLIENLFWEASSTPAQKCLASWKLLPMCFWKFCGYFPHFWPTSETAEVPPCIHLRFVFWSIERFYYQTLLNASIKKLLQELPLTWTSDLMVWWNDWPIQIAVRPLVSS